MTDLRMLEAKLADQLRRDRTRPSRRIGSENGTIVVRPSGTSCGLALRIAMLTGEDDDAVMNRVGQP